MISFSINTSDATLLLYDGARRAFDFSRDAGFLLCPGQKKGLSLRRNLCWKQNDPEIRVYRSAVSSSSCSFKHVVVAARLVLKLSNYSENIRIKEHTHTYTQTRARDYAAVFIQHVTRSLLPIGCSIYASVQFIVNRNVARHINYAVDNELAPSF